MRGEKPRFPNVTFMHVSQSPDEIVGRITLTQRSMHNHAAAICRLCPHFQGSRISCTGISEDGAAFITVTRQQHKMKWMRLRVAAAFNASCRVTYDDIARPKRKKGDVGGWE